MAEVEGYCVKCKKKQEMSDAKEVAMKGKGGIKRRAMTGKCPKCGKKVKRLIGAGAGIIFKGSGFYATDYRKNSKPSSPPAACPKANPGCTGCPGAH